MDKYKTQYSLIDPDFLKDMADTLAEGIKGERKAHDWKEIVWTDDTREAYVSALMRHLLEDDDMAAVACNAMIIHYHESQIGVSLKEHDLKVCEVCYDVFGKGEKCSCAGPYKKILQRIEEVKKEGKVNFTHAYLCSVEGVHLNDVAIYFEKRGYDIKHEPGGIKISWGGPMVDVSGGARLKCAICGALEGETLCRCAEPYQGILQRIEKAKKGQFKFIHITLNEIPSNMSTASTFFRKLGYDVIVESGFGDTLVIRWP